MTCSPYTTIANFSAYEIEGEALSNLREYALANSLYWALAEGHACEQSARRNAMDVSCAYPVLVKTQQLIPHLECFKERRRYDYQVHDPLQQLFSRPALQSHANLLQELVKLSLPPSW